MRIAYLCNSFPEPTERYVADEITELQRRGAAVSIYSFRKGKNETAPDISYRAQDVFPLEAKACIRATWLLLRRFHVVWDLIVRAFRGPEPMGRRIRTLAHTWLGAYLATKLTNSPPDHIHVHHGYFASWIGIVAARLLGVGFSLTLHGSDVLVRKDYLDVKLAECRFCFTVSEFNRRYILATYPKISPEKVLVQHLGVETAFWRPCDGPRSSSAFHIVSVGRLHAVKNHSLLILACRLLKNSGINVGCTIAGEGAERSRLEQVIWQLDLRRDVVLTGHLSRHDLRALYSTADVVALISHSEGIPLTLMEAMAMECLVLAPQITGIPELIIREKTGFLYQPGSLDDLVVQLRSLLHRGASLNRVRRAARAHILREFNGSKNSEQFARTFLERVGQVKQQSASLFFPEPNENSVLQQI